MSVPRATICSAMRTGAWRSGPPPGWPNSAPRSSTPASPSSSAGSASPGTRRIARSRFGIERDDGRVEATPVARGDARVALPRHDVCVGDHEVRPRHEAGALLDLIARLSFDEQRRTGHAVRGFGRDPVGRWRSRVGRRERVEHLGERLVAHEASEGLRLRRRRGRHAVDESCHRAVAHRTARSSPASSPARGSAATSARALRRRRAHRPRRGRPGAARRRHFARGALDSEPPIAAPTACATAATTTTNASDASSRVRGGDPLQRVGEVGDEQHADRRARARVRPTTSRVARSPSGTRPSRRPRRRRRRRGRGSSRLRSGSSGASSRAWVRKPVCATMRWSGRTDWPSTCQVRCSTSSVSIIPKAIPRAPRAGASPGRWSAGTRA